MSSVWPQGPTETDESGEAERNTQELGQSIGEIGGGGEHETIAEGLDSLLARVSGLSTREIDSLIAELRTLRKKVHTKGHGIQRDIEQYVALNQSVMQLTKIIAESMTHVRSDSKGSVSEVATSIVAAAHEL